MKTGLRAICLFFDVEPLFHMDMYLGERNADSGLIKPEFHGFCDSPLCTEEGCGGNVAVQTHVDSAVPKTVHENIRRRILQDIGNLPADLKKNFLGQEDIGVIADSDQKIQTSGGIFPAISDGTV
jgi:hypothetical protein